MITYFKNIYSVSKALCQGLAITFKTMFQPAITVQFPHAKLPHPERFRGALTFDKTTCTACNLCVKACPTACISLEPDMDPETKKRVAKVAWYTIDFGKCNYCRLCEEACPTKPVKSVRHTHDYEWSMLDRAQHFVKWVRAEAQQYQKNPAPAEQNVPAERGQEKEESKSVGQTGSEKEVQPRD